MFPHICRCQGVHALAFPSSDSAFHAVFTQPPTFMMPKLRHIPSHERAPKNALMASWQKDTSVLFRTS